jgi:TubC N-terminal docking domain
VTPADLLAELQEAGFKLAANSGGSLSISPGSALSDSQRAAIRQNKDALLALLPCCTAEVEQAPPELVWLRTANLPSAPFDLRPGVRVVDVERFRAALCNDLAAGERGSRWEAALDDVRRLRALLAKDRQ